MRWDEGSSQDFKRLGEADPKDIQKTLYKMVKDDELVTRGARRNRTYGVKKK